MCRKASLHFPSRASLTCAGLTLLLLGRVPFGMFVCNTGSKPVWTGDQVLMTIPRTLLLYHTSSRSPFPQVVLLADYGRYEALCVRDAI